MMTLHSTPRRGLAWARLARAPHPVAEALSASSLILAALRRARAADLAGRRYQGG